MKKWCFSSKKLFNKKNIGSRSRILKVSVSEGEVSVSNGQVSVSVLVSDDEVSVSVSDDEAKTPSLDKLKHHIESYKVATKTWLILMYFNTLEL